MWNQRQLPRPPAGEALVRLGTCDHRLERRTVLWFDLPGRWRWIAIVVPTLNAIARVNLVAHNPLDVVGGAAVGVAIGSAVVLVVAVGAISPRQPGCGSARMSRMLSTGRFRPRSRQPSRPAPSAGSTSLWGSSRRQSSSGSAARPIEGRAGCGACDLLQDSCASSGDRVIRNTGVSGANAVHSCSDASRPSPRWGRPPGATAA